MSKNNKNKLDSNFSKAEESPGFLLWKAANLLQKSHETVLRPLGITPAQFSMMTCLVYLSGNGNVTSAMISRHSGLDKMMISDLVKTLTRKKCIRTAPHPEDGRSFLIAPTESGLKLTNNAVRAIEKIDDEFFAGEAGLGHLKTALRALVSRHSD